MKLNKSSKLYTHAVNSAAQCCDDDQQWLASANSAVRDALLNAFACSDFLSHTCATQPGLIQQLAHPLMPVNGYRDALTAELYSATTEAQLMSVLRQFRHRHMAHITYWDSLSLQDIQTSLTHVSALADALISCAYDWLYPFVCSKFGTPENQQPLCIIAMGKLGGGELNFSSDIDLIFAYPTKGETQGARKALEHQTFFTRLAQRLINALDQVTTDGQVFRVDMRLRPFGDSGPLVTHFDAFEDYYQEQAREWERFAMVKAKVLTPDNQYKQALEHIIQPFVYKRYLDFTTLDALRDMKLKIFADSRRRQLQHNIKLGEGGIREAEFFVQSFQLIHGGQDMDLRPQGWLDVVSNLQQGGHLNEEEATSLTQAYLLLREVEHGLQQMRNAQTQTLPEADDELDWQRLALYTQSESTTHLQQRIQGARQTINRMFSAVFDEPEDKQIPQHTTASVFQPLWLGNFEHKELAEALSGYFNRTCANEVADGLITFKQKAEHAHLSSRAQQRVDALIPLILDQCHQYEQCDGPAISRILAIMSSILGRTTYLDLMFEFADVRAQLVRFCTVSPWIATQLQRFPLLLDELLSRAYLSEQHAAVVEAKQDYQDELRQTLLRVDPDDIEHQMDTLRQFKLCQQFRIAAADIHGSLPVARVSDKLTVLAEVLLARVIELAYQQMAHKYGEPDHCAQPLDSFAVLAYGKMGGYELGYGSDLDLVFIHNAPKDAVTTGQKSVSAQQFYIKMAQRIMHILNTNTLLGELYEADLRLRPAGNAGLLCCHISGFEHYQQQEAWTWEHQALVRARVVFGATQLSKDILKIRHNTLTRVRDLHTLQCDVSEMRGKLFVHSTNKSSKDHFKHGIGGITDIEFLSQYWVLAHSHSYTALTTWPDNLRIIDEAEKANLIDSNKATFLKHAYLEQRNAMHHSVLTEKTLDDINPELAHFRHETSELWQSILPAYTHS